MSIDTVTPRSRRALLFGALGGAMASAAAFVRPQATRAGTDGDLVLEATNNTDAQTELISTTSSAGLRVLGSGIGLQGWGDIGVDAYGSTIGVNAVGDGAAPAVIGWNRASSAGQLGWSTDGNESSPAVPAKTGVYGLAEQDSTARGVVGRSPAGQGVRGESTSGIGVAAVSGSGPAIDARSDEGPGVVGVGPLGFVPDPVVVKPGVYGSAANEPGVFGYSSQGYGVRGDGTGGDGVYGQTNADPNGTDAHPSHNPGAGVHGHGGQAGVLGTNVGGFGVEARSDSVPALFASNSSAVNAAIVADGGPGTAIHGHANDGGQNQVNIPSSPALTGLYGSATAAGVAVAADSASGLALRATSSAGHAIRGRGQLDGVIGESSGARSGVVGYSGGGSAPAGPGKTGVYGEATQDAASRGVSGYSLSGQGVRGEATTGQGVSGVATTGQGVRGESTGGGYGVLGVSTNGQGVRGQATTGQAVRGDAQGGVGVFGQSLGSGARGVMGKSDSGSGVRAEATTGLALDVAGRAQFSRSGRINVAANRSYVDVTVPGGLSSTATVIATLQLFRSGVWVAAARPNWPSAGKARIYLNKVASTAYSTPVAWFVLG